MKTFTVLIFVLLFNVGFAQNVGIGTLTPTNAKLQVVSANNQSLFSANAGDNTPGISISSPLGITTSINFNLSFGNAFHFMTTGYGGNLSFNPNSGTLSYSTTQTKGNPGETAFFNSTNFSLDSNGYLGLGTSSPKTRLHALNAVIGASFILPATGYVLSVGGKIICEELKVQVHTSWPDYVFEKDYSLPSLSMLENQVMNQKHLPGIPSALDVKTDNGIIVGDMQRRLLEKVEELYRYIFEMNKRSNMLEQKILTLEEELKGNK